MPGHSRKYSKARDSEVKVRIIDVLNNATEADLPTTDWIRQQDVTLIGYTTQKLARVLSSLNDMGLVVKSKSHSLNRMVYRLRAKMEDQGYTFDETKVTTRAWYGVDWELEDQVAGDEEIDQTLYE